MKQLCVGLLLALAALGGAGTVWADNAGEGNSVQAP